MTIASLFFWDISQMFLFALVSLTSLCCTDLNTESSSPARTERLRGYGLSQPLVFRRRILKENADQHWLVFQQTTKLWQQQNMCMNMNISYGRKLKETQCQV